MLRLGVFDLGLAYDRALLMIYCGAKVSLAMDKCFTEVLAQEPQETAVHVTYPYPQFPT